MWYQIILLYAAVILLILFGIRRHFLLIDKRDAGLSVEEANKLNKEESDTFTIIIYVIFGIAVSFIIRAIISGDYSKLLDSAIYMTGIIMVVLWKKALNRRINKR